MPPSPLPPDAPRSDARVLVADIGGTNARLALARNGRLLPATLRRLRNDDFPDAPSLLRAFLAGLGQHPPLAAAAIAIAGTIADDTARMGNRDWVLRAGQVADLTGAARVTLLNDLQAQGLALDRLDPGQMREILPGRQAPAGAVRLVIGLGTGFNASPVHPPPASAAVSAPAFAPASDPATAPPLVPAAEAGQACLPPLPLPTAEAEALATFLAPETGQPRIEDLLSGPGLVRAWRFFAGPAASAAPPGPERILAASARDPAAGRALALLARTLGHICADLACIHLPLGGIYLTGGLARGLAPHLEAQGFAESFRPLSHLPHMAGAFPVRLIADDTAALIGAARLFAP